MLFALLALPLLADTVPAPKIDIELQYRLRVAQADLYQTQATELAIKNAMQTLEKQMQTACGVGFQPQENQRTRKWECEPLPAPSK
jgi:hypothetical protein